MKRRIKIYGERNTNTNYVGKLIRLNLDALVLSGAAPTCLVRLRKILPGREWLEDLYFSLTYRMNLGWKHTRVKAASDLKKYKPERRKISFLTITKNPYSWLLSLHRKPYHQYYEEKPDFEAFLRTPWETVDRDNCRRRVLESPIELWNVKNHAYTQLAGLESLSMTSESFLQDPKAAIDRISRAFSIRKSDRYFTNYETSTKDQSKDFAYYQDYYLNEKWRNSLSEEAIFTINQSVDQDLMSHFGYEVLPCSAGISGRPSLFLL